MPSVEKNHFEKVGVLCYYRQVLFEGFPRRTANRLQRRINTRFNEFVVQDRLF
jgi:hypothetical protein